MTRFKNQKYILLSNIYLTLLFFRSKWQTFSTKLTKEDHLDIDSLLSTPIEPIFEGYFKPLENKSTSKKSKQKLVKTQDNPNKVVKKPLTSQEKKERNNQMARIRRFRYMEKLKQEYGYTRKDVGIRKQLQSLEEKGTITENQRELLKEMNEKHRTELDRNNENFKKKRKKAGETIK